MTIASRNRQTEDHLMQRRTFLTAAGAALAAPALPAQAQAPTRAETLLLVQEYGPNSLDM